MSERFECEELDSATLEYLRTAHRHEGDGVPGIYLDSKAAGLATAWLPLAGLITGPILIVATLFCTTWSVDDPFNVAMLQTAGVFLGAWMVLAWLRSSIASRRADYIGHFKLVDPLYVWHATGTGVFVTPLKGLDGADIDHKYDNQGNYTGARVTIYTKNGKVPVDVKSEYLAERLEAYVNLLGEFDRGMPAERGFEALDELNMREEGADSYSEDAPPPVHRLVDAIPEPHKVRSVFSWWRYPVLVVLFLIVFLCSWKVCSAMRDDEIFDIVKTRQAPELRAYLIDKRNTRHRAEVMQLLARFHDQAAQQIEGRRNADPQLRAGMASLIRATGHDAQPVITIAVKQSQDAAEKDKALFSPAGMSTLRKELIKDITEHLTPPFKPEIVPAELAAFGEVEEGHAMIEIASKATRMEERPGYRIDWTFTLQAWPEAPKFVWKTKTEPAPGAANDYNALRQQYKDVKTRFEQALPR